jgi:hypothetical protein
MKKLTLVLAAGSLLVPSAAWATHLPPPGIHGPGGKVNFENPEGFKNKGRCQSALSRETNRQRQNPDERVPIRQGESTPEFQHNIQDRFECAFDDTSGVWRVYLSD